MGLATPAAIMAGSNVAAQRGILIRDGVALEKAGEVNAIVFDKTGTLTVGKPAVVKIWEPGVSSSDGDGKPAQRPANGGLPFPQLAAALARHSSHPVSRAVAKIASADNIGLSAWEEFRGSGVQARLAADGNGQTGTQLVRLGSPRWLRENGTDLAQAAAFMDEWSAQGATLVGVSADGGLLGMLAIKDTVKAGAAKVVGQLQRQGMKTYLVTGDNPLTAAALAVQAGIPKENVFAEVKPQQKAEFVKQLQAEGQRVAFVGDGINDAPALEQSDLGIAVSRASDIAREAADIILLKSEIEAVPESVGLARATLRTIKQNLFWAFFYNAVGIPLAALGFMSPILCAAAMGLSDLVVLGNALRLRRWHLRDD
jgi:Cu+-exporting ATPase